MDIRIEVADKSHLDAWLDMRFKLWPDNTREELWEDLEPQLASTKFRALMAFDSDRPVGFLETFLRPYANGCEKKPVLFLEGIYVDENYRKSGVAKKLLDSIENWAKENGYTEICSDADIENMVSQKAHLRWGFSETERVVYFRKGL